MTEIFRLIDDLFSRLEAAHPERESLEWYTINNLRDYRGTLEADSSKQEIDNATRAFIRFCTESMDWGTPLYKACMAISALGEKLTK